MSNLETSLKFQLEALKINGWQSEYRFNAEKVGRGKGVRVRLQSAGLKDWRFDIAFPDIMLAVEVEGITHGGGRHQRIGGFNEDLKKYNQAMADGWTVYRCGGELIKSGQAIKTIEKLIDNLTEHKNIIVKSIKDKDAKIST